MDAWGGDVMSYWGIVGGNGDPGGAEVCRGNCGYVMGVDGPLAMDCGGKPGETS